MKWIFGFFLFLLTAAVVVLGFKCEEERRRKPFTVQVPIDKELFLKKVAEPAPEWMLRQIRSDLAPFREKGITSRMVEETFQGSSIFKHGLARFSFKEGHLAVGLHGRRLNDHRFRSVWAAMMKLNELVAVPDADFLVSTMDGFFNDSTDFQCPIFTFSKVEGISPFVLIPDCKALKGYEELRDEIAKGNKRYPWESKKALAYWRGGPNGAPVRWDNWDVLPRVKLVLLSLLRPELVDARFTNLHHLVYADPGLTKLFKKKGMVGRFVDKENHLKYKYQVDIDGGACTFERYFWLLFSNSVVLKQMTPNQQWYYGILEPYRHFIPVKEDLSDLVEKLNWAKEHDLEAKQIAENATQFVLEHLSTEDIYLYLYHLIVEYARLQKPGMENIK